MAKSNAVNKHKQLSSDFSLKLVVNLVFDQKESQTGLTMSLHTQHRKQRQGFDADFSFGNNLQYKEVIFPQSFPRNVTFHTSPPYCPVPPMTGGPTP